MKFTETQIQGVYSFTRDSFVDERGMFQKLFHNEHFQHLLDGEKIVEINHSFSSQAGTFRGFHYQLPPFQEIKIVQVLKGRILDFALDLRVNSSTFLQYEKLEISAESKNGFILSKGIAHGFQALEDNVEIIYFHTEHYRPEVERGIRFDDPRVNCKLPLNVKNLSERDLAFPFLDKHFRGI